WTDELPLELPYNNLKGGYPYALDSNELAVEAAIPSQSQLDHLLSKICGFVGLSNNRKLCCNKRDTCSQHIEKDRLLVREKIKTGEIQVKIKKTKPQTPKAV